MTLRITGEQAYKLTAISPLDELERDAADPSFGDAFPAELWLDGELEFSATVTSYERQHQPGGAPPVIHMEGHIEKQAMPEADDDHMWEELPQPTGFRLQFPAVSSPTGYEDKVNVDGQATLFPLP